ncbi:hypothetical protein WR25_08925 [Diploscapter pachys]|uniref:LsmAD domain-containing protein n=1 Tax=Diploscapter pachys TaxID=2018661 RepID=A0A2A2LSZ0_9BILA|nr:hypothetical protein WR25_08925 [Diploscapter pachys]
MKFKFVDIVAITTILEEQKGKMTRDFITDRDYNLVTHNANGEDVELEAWEGDGDVVDVDIEDHRPNYNNRRGNRNNNGWSVKDMFETNEKKFSVKSTFDDNLTQYTTVEKYEGTEEQQREADRLARLIEQDSKSSYYTKLENDDDERDLDKETRFEDGEHDDRRGRDYRDRRGPQGNKGGMQGQGGRSGQSGRQAQYGSPSNQQPITNRRAEGLKSGLNRGSGPGSQRFGSGGMQQTQGGSAYGAQKQGNYGGQKRDSDYGEWQNPSLSQSGRDSVPSSTAGSSSGVSMQQQQQRGGPSAGSNAGGRHDGSGQQGKTADYKMMLERNEKHKQQQAGEQKQGQSTRVTELKVWHEDFSDRYKENPQQQGQAQTAAEAQAVAGQSRSSGSAWHKGPPAGLLNNAQPQQTPPNNLQNARATESPASSDPSSFTRPSPDPPASIAKDVSPSAQQQPQLDSAHSISAAPVDAHDDHTQQAAQTEGQAKEGSEKSAATGEKKSDSEADSSTDKTEQGSVKGKMTFKFNPNAEEFKPRSMSSSTQQSGVMPTSGAPPLQPAAPMMMGPGMGPAALGPPTGQMIALPPGAAGSVVVMQPVMTQGVPMSAAGGAQSTVGMAPPPMMHGQPIMYAGGPANTAPQYHAGYPSQWQMMQTAGQGMAMAAAASQRQSTAGAAPQQIAFLQGPQRRSNQAAVMMPQTSTAAQWQGPMIVGNPPMMQMPYPSAYPTAYPTSAAGMAGPPQAGQQFAQNMQQQSLMSGAGPGVNQQGGGPPAGGMQQTQAGGPPMQPALAAQQGMYHQPANRGFTPQMAYMPQQPGMQPSMPPGNRMYGQQQMGAHQQIQPQQIQDMAQAQGVHYQVNEVYSPYLAAHQHQMFIQQGTPHTPHSQTPSIAASPYYNPSPATTGSHPSHHQTHRTTPLNPHTHSHSIHRQSSQTDGRRSTTSFKNNNHGSDRDRDRNGGPNSAQSSQPPTPGPGQGPGNMPSQSPAQPQPTPTPSIAGGARSGSPAMSTSGAPPQSYPHYMPPQHHHPTAGPMVLTSATAAGHPNHPAVVAAQHQMQQQQQSFYPTAIYYQQGGMVIPYPSTMGGVHQGAGAQPGGPHEGGPPHSHASMDGSMMAVHPQQQQAYGMQGGQEQYNQQNYMAVTGPPYFHQQQQQQQSMSRQNSVPQQQQQQQQQPSSNSGAASMTTSATSAVSQPPPSQTPAAGHSSSAASSAGGSQSPPQGSAN